MSDDDVGFVAPDALPTELKALKAFLCWRFTPPKPGEKKPRKVPYYASGHMRSGTQGDASDVAALVTYAEAVAACAKHSYTGIGMAILPQFNVVALDFDNVVQDGVIDPKVEELCSGTYTEFSPSGTGIRAFMRGSLKSRKDTKGELGGFALEVFGDTGFVTITGNVTPLCDMLGESDVVAPVSMLVLGEYETRWGAVVAGGGAVALQSENDAWLLNLGMRKGWTLDEGWQYLSDCDPSCGRDHWVKAAMAIHFEFEGSDEAFDMFHNWSKLGKSYAGQKDVESIWRSFRRSSGGQITGVWLLSWRKECLKRKVYTQVENWKTEIGQAQTEYDLREKVVLKIKEDDTLGDIERETLAQTLLDAFKRLGVKLPIAQCRKLLVKKLPVKPDHNFDPTAEDAHPEWLKGYVFVTDEDKYYRKESEEWLSVQGFNAKYNRYMPRDDNGMVTVTASVMALENYQIMTVTRGMYVPWAAPIFREEGSGIITPTESEALTRSWMVNTYRHSAVPLAAEEIGAGAEQGVKLVIGHIIDLVCSNDPFKAQIMLSWLAHNVQHPGRKIRYAPVVQGIEGDGKSLIGALLSAVMGESNVKTITPTVLATDFTGWAEGACVAVLEELRIVGHSRYDIHNRVKPMITNDRIEVHKKGRDPYDVLNTQNYICFTNFKDAIPVGENDRRFFVISIRFGDSTKLTEYLQKFGGNDLYFERLHAAIYKYKAELRRFFLDYQLSPEFNPNGRAPYTIEKASMAAMSQSDEEQLVVELIEAGGMGIAKDVLCSSYLGNAITLSDAGLNIDRHMMHRILVKLGWAKYPKRVKWQRKADYAWSKGDDMNWDAIREKLDKTVAVPKLDADDLFF